MAKRIRSIKAEILEDERSSCLSSDAWRLWVSMWLIADDLGRVRGNSRQLAATCFWGCPHGVSVDECLKELVSSGVIKPYTVRGQLYYEIVNWGKHQRIDNAGKSTIPDPSEADPENDTKSSANCGEPPQPAANDGHSPLFKDKDKDKESAAKPLKLAAEKSPLPGDPSKVDRKLVDTWRDDAERVLDALNAARKKVNTRSYGIKPSYTSLVHIAGRLSEGRTFDECLRVIEVCVEECRRKADSFEWFDSATPFRPEGFERKLARATTGSGENSKSVIAELQRKAEERMNVVDD